MVSFSFAAFSQHGLFDPLDVEDERRARSIVISTIMSSEWGSHTKVMDKFQVCASTTVPS